MTLSRFFSSLPLVLTHNSNLPRERVGGRYYGDTSPSVRSLLTDIIWIEYLWDVIFQGFSLASITKITHIVAG